MVNYGISKVKRKNNCARSGVKLAITKNDNLQKKSCIELPTSSSLVLPVEGNCIPLYWQALSKTKNYSL